MDGSARSPPAAIAVRGKPVEVSAEPSDVRKPIYARKSPRVLSACRVPEAIA